MKKKIFFLIIAVFLISIISLVFIDNDIQEIKAAVPLGNQELRGWAWSDTVGWISFNCSDFSPSICPTSDYQVSVNPNDGIFSGYAWSEHIGWIKFFEDIVNDLNNDPDGGSGGVILQDSNFDGIGEITGWARACAAAPNQATCSGAGAHPNAGGWDGWIKMDGVSVDLETGKFSGFAWGSDVVGWISFNRKDCDINENGIFEGASEGAPTGCPSSGTAYDYFVKKDVINNLPINLKANNTAGSITINSGDTANISWALASPYDATKCYPLSGEANWQSQIIKINNQLPLGIYTTPSLSSDTTYQLKCVGILGWGIESVNVNIAPPPGFSLSLSTSTIKAIVFGKTLSADSSTTTITVNPTGGYNGQARLSVSGGMPIGSIGIFNPPFSPSDYTRSGNIPVDGKADFSLLNVPKGVNGAVTIHGEDINNSAIQSDVLVYFRTINYDPNIIEK